MIGWYRRVRFKEQKKLAWQSVQALAYAGGWYAEKSDEMVSMLSKWESFAKQCEQADGLLMHEDTKRLLDINRELRRLCDGPVKIPKPFDKQFVPLGGWKAYFAHIFSN